MVGAQKVVAYGYSGNAVAENLTAGNGRVINEPAITERMKGNAEEC
jgi:hypothetical protein